MARVCRRHQHHALWSATSVCNYRVRSGQECRSSARGFGLVCPCGQCVYTVVVSSGLYETTLNQFQTSLFFFFHPFYFRILALKLIFLKNGRFVQSSAQCVMLFIRWLVVGRMKRMEMS